MGYNISLYGQSLQQSETRDESRIEGGHRVSWSVRGDDSTLELESVSQSVTRPGNAHLARMGRGLRQLSQKDIVAG
jgi:hypothetical protein